MRVHGLPRRHAVAFEAQRIRCPGRIAERKIETDQDAVAAPCQFRDDAFQEGACLQPRLDVDGLVLQLQPGILGQDSDPDGVLPRHRLGRGTPVHHYIGIKQARHD